VKYGGYNLKKIKEMPGMFSCTSIDIANYLMFATPSSFMSSEAYAVAKNRSKLKKGLQISLCPAFT
jgi:hypothetical protein